MVLSEIVDFHLFPEEQRPPDIRYSLADVLLVKFASTQPQFDSTETIIYIICPASGLNFCIFIWKSNYGSF